MITECDHLFPINFPQKACITLLTEAYVITNPDSIQRLIDNVIDSLSGKNYSYLYIYRTKGHEYPGAKNRTFNVIVDSANVFHISQSCNYAIKVTPGKHIVKIENSKQEIIFDAAAGYSYYIKAIVDKNTGFTPGQVVITFGGWYKTIKLIDDIRAGKLEYDVITFSGKTIQQ